MVKTSVAKNKFSQLNDKRSYSPDGVASLPFYHPILSKINEFKKKEVENLKNIFEKRRSKCII